MWKIFDVKNNSFMKHFMYCIKMDFARCVVCTQRVVFFTEQKKLNFLKNTSVWNNIVKESASF